jgi:hypothetical protein
MNPRRFIGVAAFIFISPALQGQDTKEPSTTKSDGVLYQSPKGSYRLEKGPNDHSVWVVSAKNPSQRRVLSTEPGDRITSDDCFASPDEKWLLMHSELFQQIDALKFIAFKKKGWFKSKLYDFVDKHTHQVIRRWTWTARGWSSDSNRLTIDLNPPDGSEAISFNVRTGRFKQMVSNEQAEIPSPN